MAAPVFFLAVISVLSLDQPKFPESKICVCASARTDDSWCGKCQVGYLGGVRIPSKAMLEVLDAHGHTIDPASLRCPDCRKHQQTGGYCSRCRMGFVRGKVYLSHWAYRVAGAERVPVKRPSCETCQKHRDQPSWCEDCKVGIVGNLLLRKKTDFDVCRKSYVRLQLAVKRLENCERCALATVSGGYCRLCKLSYRQLEGQPLSVTPLVRKRASAKKSQARSGGASNPKK